MNYFHEAECTVVCCQVVAPHSPTCGSLRFVASPHRSGFDRLRKHLCAVCLNNNVAAASRFKARRGKSVNEC